MKLQVGCPDRDGASNYFEYLTATDPKQAASCWRINIQKSNQVVHITFPQVANRGFELQFDPDIKTKDWVPLDDPINRPFFGTNGTRTITQPITDARTFYRMRVYDH